MRTVQAERDILELLDAMRCVKDIGIAHVQQLERAKLAEENGVARALGSIALTPTWKPASC